MENFFALFQGKLLDIIGILIVISILYTIGSVLVGWLIGRFIGHTYDKSMPRKDLEKRRDTLVGLAKNIWRIIVVLVGLFAIARLFISAAALTPLFASAGIVGIAFGFGAQAMVRDFITGLFIISENQYRIGDVIEINGFSGTVERIGTRSTVLRDVDGNVHYFPNGIIDHVINKTMGYSKARLRLAVDPETDIDQAIGIINAIGTDLAEEDEWKDKIIEAPQYVMMGEIGATAVELIISGKVQPSDQWSVSAELRRRILFAFEDVGIKLGVTPGTSPIVAALGRSAGRKR